MDNEFRYRTGRQDGSGTIVLASFLAASLIVWTLVPGPRPAVAEEGGDIGLSDMVETVKKALVNLSFQLGRGGAFTLNDVRYDFVSAQLTVHLTNKVEGGGEFGFSVVTLEAGAETEATQTVVVTLMPPKPGDKIKQSSEATARLLADLLRDAVAELEASLGGEPPLAAGDVTVSSKFAVEKAAGGGFKFTFFGIGADTTAKLTNANAQEIALTFAPTDS